MSGKVILDEVRCAADNDLQKLDASRGKARQILPFEGADDQSVAENQKPKIEALWRVTARIGNPEAAYETNS